MQKYDCQFALFRDSIRSLQGIWYLIIPSNPPNLFRDITSFALKYKPNSVIRNLQNATEFNTANFMNTLTLILDGTYKINNSNLDEIEKDILITYGFRNFGAHKIEE